MNRKKPLLLSVGNRPVYFISPHLDDAVLSCGILLAKLAKQTEVTVVTVFTACHADKMTLSAQRFVKKCGETDAEKLFQARKEEDKRAAKMLGIKNLHLNYTDGTWRKRKEPGFLRGFLGTYFPEFVHLYPTFLHVGLGRIHPEDEQIKAKLEKDLKKILPKDAVVFAPLAVGCHIDHVLVRETLSQFKGVTYWSDFPYNLIRRPDKDFIQKINLQSYSVDGNFSKKKKAIEAYASQLPSLFLSKGIPYRKEVYYSAA